MPSLRRRSIEDGDLDAVATLLAAGFPDHPVSWWRRGLERLRLRACTPGYLRYGRLLVSADRLVGVLLTINARIPVADGETVLRRNLSSWYVLPEFAAQASLLLGAAARDRDVTTFNISPAPHTQSIIEAQGFRAFAQGALATVPILARRGEAAVVREFQAGDAAHWFDGPLVADHGTFGCRCLVVEAEDGPHPFVFTPVRRLSRLLPAAHLLYCRDIAGFTRFARPLGIALALRGVASVIVVGPARLPGVPGRPFNRDQGKYAVGPHPPRAGDLAYSELAIFH